MFDEITDVTQGEQLLLDFANKFTEGSIVDLDQLCSMFPRMGLVRKIAEANKFMHWELEFAELFAERGGFDLIIGNPPWIKIEWNEQGVLSDTHPMFAVKKLTATQVVQQRKKALNYSITKELYFSEYESLSGMQNFLNAAQNYPELKGQQTNLFKCFLPQAWKYGTARGVSAFIHPDGVFDDPNGGYFREIMYPKLRKHFQFTNELKLFSEVHHNTVFSLNVYCNEKNSKFEMIANLFAASTIEQCYDISIFGKIPGIKDDENNWNISGHPARIVRIGRNELALFAQLFDGTDNWKQARLPVLHTQVFLEVLECFVNQKTLGNDRDAISYSEMWHETNAQNEGVIERKVHFPDSPMSMIYSGPHIGVANPLFKTSRKICRLNSDYDNIDLQCVSNEYWQRCNYEPCCSIIDYNKMMPTTPWGINTDRSYRIIARKMLNISGERTLIAIMPPLGTGHIHGIFGVSFRELKTAIQELALCASLPLDFFVKVLGKSNLQSESLCFQTF